MDLVPQQEIESRIFAIGNVQAMLDRDLALLFKTETRTLKQAVNRNINRFPSDFMFELTDDMISLLVSQSVIPSKSFLGGARPNGCTNKSCIATEICKNSPTSWRRGGCERSEQTGWFV